MQLKSFGCEVCMVPRRTRTRRQAVQADVRIWILPFIVFALLALAAVNAAGQSATGNIAGYVKDPSGAAIADVTVTAKMVEQQTVQTAQTNAEGFYTILALPPGRYELTFEAKGFAKQTLTGLELTVGQNLRADAVVQLGSV